jgi:putative membrane protein
MKVMAGTAEEGTGGGGERGARPRPAVIELDFAQAGPSPAEVPPVPEPDGPVMPVAGPGRATAPASAAARLLGWAGGGFVALVLGTLVWDFVTGLLARSPLAGGLAAAMLGLAVLGALLLGLREWRAWARLGRIGAVRDRAAAAAASGDLAAARGAVGAVAALYAAREEMAGVLERHREAAAGVLDADAALAVAERMLLAPLDARAAAEIEAAARRVAAATALVPLALADVAVALVANVAMIRRIAEIYGGRSGSLGSWRLMRRVFGHLVATGALAVGDDLVASVAGGGILSRLSRRFGEGVVNGALTARVGVAAVEVCRPLPFAALERPRVGVLLARALAGVFDRNGAQG